MGDMVNMRFRIKKQCGKCQYLKYNHIDGRSCALGSILANRSKFFIAKSSNPIDCRDKRQAAYYIFHTLRRKRGRVTF